MPMDVIAMFALISVYVMGVIIYIIGKVRNGDKK